MHTSLPPDCIMVIHIRFRVSLSRRDGERAMYKRVHVFRYRGGVMENRGVSVNLFLLDGDPLGAVKASMANWAGVAYRIPRTELNSYDERGDLKQSGVYFLFGIEDDESVDETRVVYIGQASARKNGEGLLCRLKEHRANEDKGYWTEAVCILSNWRFGWGWCINLGLRCRCLDYAMRPSLRRRLVMLVPYWVLMRSSLYQTM